MQELLGETRELNLEGKCQHRRQKTHCVDVGKQLKLSNKEDGNTIHSQIKIKNSEVDKSETF